MPWKENDSSTSKLIKSSYEIFTFLLLSYKVVCASIAVQYRELKFEEAVLDCGTINIVMAMAALLCVFYGKNRLRFKNIIDNMDEIIRKMSYSGLGNTQYFYGIYERDAQIISKMTKVFVCGTVVCGIAADVSVPIIGLFTGTYRHKLPQKNYCPFENTDPGVYEYVFIIQFVSLISCGLVKLTHDMMIVALYRIQTLYFKYLSEVLEQFQEEKYMSRKIAKKKLCQWVKIHQDVISNVHALNKFFSPVIILYYVSFIAIVAGGLFYQLNAKDANFLQANFVGLYMAITLVYMYLQCHVAEDVNHEAAKLAVQAYNLPWYRLGKWNGDTIRLIISVCNDPIHVTAYRCPTFRLSRECFQAFVTSTVSAYMGFSKINEL